MPASFSGTFSAANDVSGSILLAPGQELTYTTTESAPGTYSIKFVRSTVPGTFWEVISTITSDTSTTTVRNETGKPQYYRLQCASIAVVTVDYTLIELTGEVISSLKNPQTGQDEISYTDVGVTIERNLQVDGDLAVTGSITGASSAPTILIAPGATAPAQTTEGSIVWDTNDDLLTVGTGAGRTTMVDVGSTQAVTGVKTFTTPVLTNPVVNAGSGTIVLPAATSPAQTAEGSIVWDSDDDLLTVGDGASRKTMVDVGSTQAITGVKTLTTPVLTNPVVNAGSGTIVLPAASSPAQTAEGSIVWDSDDDLLTVGDGAGRKTMVDVGSTQAVTGVKTFTTPVLTAATVTAQATDATIGTVAAPASGTTAVTIAKLGNFFVLTFTLTAARIAVTDDGGNGAYGATKLFDFVEGGISFLGCRQNYTAYTPDGTGVPTDDEFVIGVGNTAIVAAADAVLAAANQNVGASIAQTLVAGTTTGTAFTAANSAFDGTGTAADLYLNYSGDDVTTDGNGTLDVTGTITVVGVFLGDD